MSIIPLTASAANPPDFDRLLGTPRRSLHPAFLDNSGRIRTSEPQNIFDADFEYGLQPSRWESIALNGGTITHSPRDGGVRMSLPTTAGALTIRQSRQYIRYQPGKSTYVASGIVFGPAPTNSVQRFGLFDDGNGAFFEQTSAGMFVVRRSDANGVPVDTRVPQSQWNGDSGLGPITDPNSRLTIDWNAIQMVWIELAWYGAGIIRFGVILDGVHVILHTFRHANVSGSLRPWARTANLPVRYEQRNTGVASAPSDIFHWGVSVITEGRSDPQRGFLQSYGTPARRSVPANSVRFPLTSFRLRPMGIVTENNTATAGSATSLSRTAAAWIANQWQGAYLFTTGGTGAGQMARILSNTVDTLTLADNITGAPLATPLAAGTTYQIGYPSRGQITPLTLVVSSDAVAQIELIYNAATLTGVTWTDMSSLGSPDSFAQRDISATGLTMAPTGNSVFAFTSPAGGSGLLQLDLREFFPLGNNVRGNIPDTLTVAISTGGGTTNASAHIIAQEAMS